MSDLKYEVRAMLVQGTGNIINTSDEARWITGDTLRVDGGLEALSAVLHRTEAHDQ